MVTGIGQRSKLIAYAVNVGGDNNLPECNNTTYDCPFMIPVFADGSSDDLKNDKSSLLGMYQNWTTAVVFKIQKYTGSWINKATITNNTYGEFYALGYWADKPKYTGIVIYWKTILSAFGEGEYRVSIAETNPLGTTTSYTKEYCLQNYNCGGIDNTVRLEWYLNNGIGDIDNDLNILDFADINWYSQLRIPESIFGYPKSSYEKEEMQFQNGEFQDVTNIQTEKYTLKTGLLPSYIHNILKTYACQADELFITDYSSNNPQVIIQKSVKLTSEYAPKWRNTIKCSPVVLEFEPRNNRLEKFRCLP